MSKPRPLSVVAFGAHPDDVELSCGGTLALLAAAGERTVIVDLTRGEMGSRGTPETRNQEAARAAEILGAAGRENLDLGDARLEVTLAARHRVAEVIRRHRPDLVLAPWGEDPHPDHAAAGRLVREAAFDARLAKLDLGHPPWAPGLILFYPGHRPVPPTVVVDISDFFPRKMEAVRAYRSQFPEEGRRSEVRPVGFDDYLWHIESRARHHGSLIEVRYAEGFVIPDPLPLRHPGLLLAGRGGRG